MTRQFLTLTIVLSALTFGGTTLALQPGWTTPDASDDAVFYPDCATARVLGAAPLRRGEPGYRAPLDADGDGWACEPLPGTN